MNLPNIPINEYCLTIQDKHFTYVPFTIAQEKLMLMIKNDDPKIVADGISQLLKQCIRNIDPNDLNVYQQELTFLKIYSKSVDAIIPIVYKCNNDVSEKEEDLKPCGGRLEYKLNLEELDVVVDEDHQDIFTIREEPVFAIKMKYPSLADALSLGEDEDEDQNIDNTYLLHIIDNIIVGEQVYNFNDPQYTPEAKLRFISQLTYTQKLDIFTNFVGKMPQVECEFSIECEKCGHNHEFTLRGLKDIFG